MKRLLAMTLMAAMLMAGIGYADTDVYTTKTGTKYHSTDKCKGLSNAKEIFTKTESEAIKKGLSKCSICWEDSTEQPQTTEAVDTTVTESSETTQTTQTTQTTTTTTETTTESVVVPTETPAPVVTKPSVKKITLAASKTKLKKGKKLKIKLKNSTGKVKWSLSNKKAKIVKKTKKYVIIKGKKKGTVTVKASVGGTVCKFKVKIK